GGGASGPFVFSATNGVSISANPLPQGNPWLDVFVGPAKSLIADAIYLMNLGRPTAVSQSAIDRLQPNTIQQKNGAIMLGVYGLSTGIGDLSELITSHAFVKHVLEQGEWPGWIRTTNQMRTLVQTILKN